MSRQQVINAKFGFEVSFEQKVGARNIMIVAVSDNFLDGDGLGPEAAAVVELINSIQQVCQIEAAGVCAVMGCNTPEDRVEKSYFHGKPENAYILTCHYHRGHFGGWTTEPRPVRAERPPVDDEKLREVQDRIIANDAEVLSRPLAADMNCAEYRAHLQSEIDRAHMALKEVPRDVGHSVVCTGESIDLLDADGNVVKEHYRRCPEHT